MKSSREIAYVVLILLVLIRLLTFSSSAEVKVYRSVSTEKKQIALTFDDGPHPTLTHEILDILERYGIRARSEEHTV